MRNLFLAVLIFFVASAASAQSPLLFDSFGTLSGVLDAFNLEDNGCEYCTNNTPLAFRYTGTPNLDEIYYAFDFHVDPLHAIPFVPQIFADDSIHMISSDIFPEEGWTQLDFDPPVAGFAAWSTGDAHMVTAVCDFGGLNDFEPFVQNEWFALECPGGINRIRYETLGGRSDADWDTIHVPEPGLAMGLMPGLLGLFFLARRKLS